MQLRKWVSAGQRAHAADLLNARRSILDAKACIVGQRDDVHGRRDVRRPHWHRQGGRREHRTSSTYRATYDVQGTYAPKDHSFVRLQRTCERGIIPLELRCIVLDMQIP